LTVRRPLFVFNSYDFYGFAAELERVGPEGVPILKAEFGLEAPRELTRFDRWKSHPRPEVTAIHFYAQDSQLRSIARGSMPSSIASSRGSSSFTALGYRRSSPIWRIVWNSGSTRRR